MDALPTIGTYGNYASGNYGLNALRVTVGSLTVYFSYRTPVAFHVFGHNPVVRENDWGPTTGKHLNWIDGGKKLDRISDVNFVPLLAAEIADREATMPAVAV